MIHNASARPSLAPRSPEVEMRGLIKGVTRKGGFQHTKAMFEKIWQNLVRPYAEGSSSPEMIQYFWVPFLEALHTQPLFYHVDGTLDKGVNWVIAKAVKTVQQGLSEHYGTNMQGCFTVEFWERRQRERGAAGLETTLDPLIRPATPSGLSLHLNNVSLPYLLAIRRTEQATLDFCLQSHQGCWEALQEHPSAQILREGVHVLIPRLGEVVRALNLPGNHPSPCTEIWFRQNMLAFGQHMNITSPLFEDTDHITKALLHHDDIHVRLAAHLQHVNRCSSTQRSWLDISPTRPGEEALWSRWIDWLPKGMATPSQRADFRAKLMDASWFDGSIKTITTSAPPSPRMRF